MSTILCAPQNSTALFLKLLVILFQNAQNLIFYFNNTSPIHTHKITTQSDDLYLQK